MTKKQRRARQKRFLKNIPKDPLRRKAESAVSQANIRIKTIGKTYGDNTWGVKRLKDIIPDYLRHGKIEIPKNASEMELLNIYKETKRFLDSKYSSKKGIDEIIKKTKQSIKENLSAEDEEITEEDVTDYYSMFGDNDFTSFLSATGLKASDVWAVIDDSISYGDDENQFLKRLERLITIVDEDIRSKAKRLYHKYVESKI